MIFDARQNDQPLGRVVHSEIKDFCLWVFVLVYFSYFVASENCIQQENLRMLDTLIVANIRLLGGHEDYLVVTQVLEQ